MADEHMLRKERCPTCEGEGCADCDGTGIDENALAEDNKQLARKLRDVERQRGLAAIRADALAERYAKLEGLYDRAVLRERETSSRADALAEALRAIHGITRPGYPPANADEIVAYVHRLSTPEKGKG